MTTLITFGILAIASYVTTSSIQSRNSCPSPSFCYDNDPENCLSIEQGYFMVEEQLCPGCNVCIYKDGYFDSNGCQLRACPMYGRLPGCTSPRFRRQFYTKDGHQCNVCDAITCGDGLH